MINTTYCTFLQVASYLMSINRNHTALTTLGADAIHSERHVEKKHAYIHKQMEDVVDT